MLQTVCEKLHIESVLDVGPGNSPDIPKMLSQCPVKGGGWMEEENLSRLLSNCIAGVVEYNPNVWEKSGVMAAYEAHRLVPMLVELEPQTIFSRSSLPYVLAENIANGHEFSSTFDDSELQKIADAAFHYLSPISVSRAMFESDCCKPRLTCTSWIGHSPSCKMRTWGVTAHLACWDKLIVYSSG